MTRIKLGERKRAASERRRPFLFAQFLSFYLTQAVMSYITLHRQVNSMKTALIAEKLANISGFTSSLVDQ